MTYAEILFRRPDDGVIHPDEARRLVAAACDKIDIDPAIFSRDGAGNPLQGVYEIGGENDVGKPPRVVFDGGRGYVRMYGLGREGSLLLLNEGSKVMRGLSAHGFRAMDIKEGEMSITSQADGYIPLYATRCVVVAKKPGASQKFIRAPLQGDVAQCVAGIVLRGLTGVARMLDEDLLARGMARRFEKEIPTEIEILQGVPTTVPIRPGIPAAAYKHVLMNVGRKLNGPWGVGMLRSRGYGLIRTVNPARMEACPC